MTPDKRIEEIKNKSGVINDSLWYVNPKHIREALTQHTQDLMSDLVDKLEDMKKSQTGCTCGGEFVKEYGAGFVLLSLQCDTYTDYIHNGYNNALIEAQTIIKTLNDTL